LPFDGGENGAIVNRSELDNANFWHEGIGIAVGTLQEEGFSQHPAAPM
jgi:hypothetical protein